MPTFPFLTRKTSRSKSFSNRSFFFNLEGHIPLRHLVYRVHALPESMRPLVWDFGQLKPEIEELYIRQIVTRFVSLFSLLDLLKMEDQNSGL